MSKKVNSFASIALLSALAAFCMGVEACSEPKEYCKVYSGKEDRMDCTDYCAKSGGFNGKEAKNEVKACQYGQFLLLNNPRYSAAEAVLECDRQFKDVADIQKACRVGVAAEELRCAKSGKGAGSSTDRETGNRR